MKKDTQDLLDAALDNINNVPIRHLRLYTNYLLLRDHYQNLPAELRQKDLDDYEALLGELSECSNDPLTPHDGTSFPWLVISASRFKNIRVKVMFEKLEASDFFKKSFALVNPLVAEVRRLEALLESERVAALEQLAAERKAAG